MSNQIEPIAVGQIDNKNIKVTEYGVEVLSSLSPQEWCEAVQSIGKFHSKAQFYLGDLVVYAEGINNTWGEKYDELVEITGYENQTLRHYATIARKFPIQFREEIFVPAQAQITFEHFKAVQSLDPEVAKYFLQRAGESNWSTRRLAEEVAKHKGREPRGDKEIFELPSGWEEIKAAKKFGGFIPAPKGIDEDTKSYLVEIQEWEIEKMLSDYEDDDEMLSFIDRLRTAIE